ncbi:MAG: carbohydrate binding family 9 domain-containing protein [Candidatus Aminicenantes bacterium]|nr:carbohydrate binding family 9 domain-containing protein [Candidatus Aminicenantes bacterium]
MSHRIKFVPILMIICLLFISALPGIGLEKEQPLVAFKTDTPPVIDGKLDDPVWQKAPFVKGFKTWHPDFGIDMVDDTIVYIAYDKDNLYFGFRCFDSEPDKIKASITSRDHIRPDDWIGINLDTFNDNQSLYIFYCNPLGIQQDSRAEGGDEDYTVDIVWYSAGHIDKEGYVVEIQLPFKSIRFTQKSPVEMGVIFERQVSRQSVMGTYPPLDPKQGTNWFTQTMPFFLPEVKPYKLIELLPAVTYRDMRSLDEGRLVPFPGGQGDLSLTGKYGLTSDLILDGTLNPDFSQVESDAGQVDFNRRYALFFPEKRPFFLEGLEKFNFGGFHSGDYLSEIVHTRTVVNPLLGFKLNGKAGDKNVLAALYSLDELPDTEVDERAHFGIFRYKRILAQDGFIGGFYTGRERDSGFNRVFGLDGQLRVSQAGIFGFHGFLSQTHQNGQESRDDGHALGLHYFSNTRNWLFMLGFQNISEDFRTETGYITRTGVTRFRSGAVKMFYPPSKMLPRIDVMVHSFQIHDKFSDLFETANTLDTKLYFLRNSFILVGYGYSNEIFLGERFSTSGPRIIAQSQFTKDFSFSFSYYSSNKIRYVENPYQGYGSDASVAITLLPSENLHLDFSLIYSDFYRETDATKEYDYMIVRSRNVYQVNKYLFFRAIVEYNSFRKQVLTDFLASFTYIPGTVVHIGYGSLYEKIQWMEGEYRPANNYLESQRGFFFKASYLWRF